MNVEQLVEWELAGETEVLRENPSLYNFVQSKFHVTWPGIEPRLPLWEAGDCLSSGMAVTVAASILGST
jgi:hypothetical protein